MSAGIELYNNVLNQLGSPALYSDIFANRPAFGYTGRLFISTDTLEIYRDTGTAWQLLSSGGGGGTNIYNTNGTLTGNRTLTNGGFSLTFTGAASSFVFNLDANTNVSRQLNFTTGTVKRWSTEITDNETGANAGSNYYLRSFQDGGTSLLDVLSITRSTGVVSHNSNAVLSTAIDNLTGIYNVNRGTYTSATYTGGNPQNGIYNIFTHDARINQTYGNGQYIAAAANIWRFEPTDSYTLTLTQATGVRTMGAALYGNQYNIPVGKTETVSHLSGITLLGIYDLFTGGRGTLAVTNAYGLVINDLNEYAYGTLTLTNRWGIYQGGASDSNYLNGNTLIGSTTSTGEKLQVTGTARVTQSAYLATASGKVYINTTTDAGAYVLQVAGAAYVAGTLAINTNGDTRTITTNKAASSQGQNMFVGGGGASLTYTSGADASFNNSFGINSLASITTGYSNNAYGNGSLQYLTTGVENNAFGFNSGRNITSGGMNVAMGHASLGAASTVVGSVAIGERAMGDGATTGNYNVGVGSSALRNVTSGALNTGIGLGTLRNITTGNNLVAIGAEAGRYLNNASNNVTSSNSVYVGYNTRASADGNTNENVFGNDARGNGSNTTTIGNTSTVGTYFPSGKMYVNTTTDAGAYALQVAGAIYNTTGAVLAANSGNVLIGKTSDDGALLQLKDAGNISFGTTTGTKIGTSTSQKLAFYNATPIAQPTTAVGSAPYASPGAGSTVKTDDTFGGYTLRQVVQALQNLGILA